MRIKISILLTTLVLISCSGLSLATEKTNVKPPAISSAQKHFQEGRQALFQGKYEPAIELLKKAVEEDKTKTSYRLHLSRACYYAGREQEAEKLLSDILKET
ncbi:MAG: tetratricopeptide repeat protein, partial [Planctomycetota bacterium]